MNPFAVARLQRARGERRNLPDQLTSEDLLRRQVHRLRPTVVEGLVEDPSKLRVLRNLNDRVNQSSFWHGDPDTVWGWHCTDIVEVGYCDELAPLGACDAGDLDNWNGCAPARTAISREFERAALSDGSRLAQQRRWINQHQPRPLFPRPSDAVALRWWYWTAAAFQQIGAREFGSEEPLDDWDLDPLTADERLWADVSRLARAAVPYWLPPGQTYAYLGGDPLSAEDRDEIRLPYGSTMLVPSEPLRIDATGRRADADLGEALLASRIMAASRAEKSRSISSIDYRDGGVTIGDAIGAYGADIEAVVVEADQNGRRTDRILWCLAISVEDYVLGRVVVPALRSRSVWADVVDDLCATIAWGSWVDHEIDDTDSEAKKKRSSVNVEAPIVKVLDVRPPADDSGAATRTGRTIAPHTRAGHWRRQHHGPGGELVKRIRIAPTLVNASHGPLAPKVYRLPRPARAAEATS